MSSSSVTVSVFWAFMDKLGNKVFSFLVFLVLAYKLDPVDFGVIAIARLFLDYLDMVASQGLGSAIIQSNNLTPNHLDTAFWMNLLASLMLSVGIVLVADPIAGYYDMPVLSGIVPVLALGVVLGGLNRSHSALLEKKMAFRTLAVIGVVTSIVGGGIAVVMAFLDYGVWALVAQQLISGSVRMVMLWCMTSWRPGFGVRLHIARDLFHFGWKVMLDQQVLYFSKRLDEFLVSILLGTTALGFYSLAKRFQAVFQTVVLEPVIRVMLPVYSRLQDDRTRLCRQIFQHVQISGIIVVPLFAGLAMLSPELVALTVGDKWAPAENVMTLLFASSILILAPRFLKTAFVACGRPELALKSNLIRAASLVVLVPVFAPLGLTGLGLAIIIREFFGYVADIYIARKDPGIRSLPFLFAQTRTVLPSLIIVPLCELAESFGYSPALTVLISVALSVPAYIVLILLVNRDMSKKAVAILQKKPS